MSKLTKECHYDREAIYDKEIAPLAQKLFALCRRHGLPMSCTIQFRSDVESNGMGHFMLVNDDSDKKLSRSPLLIAQDMAYTVLDRAMDGDARSRHLVSNTPLLVAALERAQEFEDASADLAVMQA